MVHPSEDGSKVTPPECARPQEDALLTSRQGDDALRCAPSRASSTGCAAVLARA